jgi:hypothetical protein
VGHDPEECVNDETLLDVAHRGRPATIDDLATLAHTPVGDVTAAVRRLRDRGQLGGRGEEIRYTSPAVWAAESVSSRAAQLRSTARELLDEIEQIVTELPRTIAHWTVGEASTDPMPVLIRHGARASEDLWYELGVHDSGVLDAVMPDLSRFLTSSEDRVARISEAMRSKDAVRVIIPTVAADASFAELLVAFTAAGIEYRFLDDPPSWFWVDGDQLAVPFEWGEQRPTSVMSVRNAALAGMVSNYFETLWRAATPASPPASTATPWTPLLTLMRRGITLEAASRMVGVNPRTGRRRIAQAMTHYGVSTLFALGVAWAADADASPREPR